VLALHQIRILGGGRGPPVFVDSPGGRQ